MLKMLCKSLAMICLVAFNTAAWAGGAHWIDVRTADEFNAGHVDGAVNIPYGDISERIAEVTENRDELIYLYCRSGRRSGIAKDTLDQAGFSNVVNLGGFEDDVGIRGDHGLVAEKNDVPAAFCVTDLILDEFIVDLEDLEEAVGEIGGEEIRQRLMSWNGHARHADTYLLRQKLFATIAFRRNRSS